MGPRQRKSGPYWEVDFPLRRKSAYLYGCMVLSFDGKMGFPDDPEGTLISKENRFDPVWGQRPIFGSCRSAGPMPTA